MELTKRIVLTMLLIFSFSSFLYAEAVFHKNGKIIEGKIIGENNHHVTLNSNGIEMKIPRSKIIRVIYTDDFKKVKYIYKNDGSYIKGYIVSEEGRYYIIREHLNVNIEKKIAKRNVKGIMNEPITRNENKNTSTTTTQRSKGGVVHNVEIFLGILLNSDVGSGSFMLRFGYMANIPIIPNRLYIDLDAAFGASYTIERDIVDFNLDISAAASIDILFANNFGLYVGPLYHVKWEMVSYTWSWTTWQVTSSYNDPITPNHYIGGEIGIVKIKESTLAQKPGFKIGLGFLGEPYTRNFILTLTARILL